MSDLLVFILILFRESFAWTAALIFGFYMALTIIHAIVEALHP